MSVEGEPPVDEWKPSTLKVNFSFGENGELFMTLMIPTSDGTALFTMTGENLQNFYHRFKDAMEGKDKPPAYLT